MRFGWGWRGAPGFALSLLQGILLVDDHAPLFLARIIHSVQPTYRRTSLRRNRTLKAPYRSLCLGS